MKPSKPSPDLTPDLKDDDIRALLDAQSPTRSPADLDARIIAAAKAEVQSGKVIKAQPVFQRSRYGSWLAVAAVAVLAVILVPVMQQSDDGIQLTGSPDVSLNDTAESTSDLVATEVAEFSAESVQQRSVSTSEKSLENAGVNRSDLVSTDALQFSAEEAATLPPAVIESRQANDSALSAASKIKKAVVSDIDAMTDDDIRKTFKSHPYRADRKSWEAEIARLTLLKETVQVVRETRLFERMYPEER